MAAGNGIMRESNVVRRAKQRAKRISVRDGITHQQALDRIAVEAGHAHWAAMAASVASSAIVAASPASPKDLDAEWTKADLRNAFALPWLRASMRAGLDAHEHYVGAARVVAAPRGSLPDRDSAFANILASCLVALAAVGDAMSPSSVSDWVSHLADGASLAFRARQDEAAAAKQTSSARLSEEFIAKLTEMTSPDVFDAEAIRMIRDLSDDDYRTAIRDVVNVSRMSGRIEPASLFRVLGEIPFGIVVMLLTGRGVRIPLAQDERTALLTALSIDRSYDEEEAIERIDRLRLRTPALRDSIDALRSYGGLQGRDDVVRYLSTPCRLFPDRAGSALDVRLVHPEGLDRVRNAEDTVFASWFVDAVVKAERGDAPFRYNPLIHDGAQPHGGVGIDPDRWGRVRESFARPLILSVLDLREPGASGAVATLSALADLLLRGLERGTMREIASVRGDKPNIAMIASILEEVGVRGVEQLLLYARIVGLDADGVTALSGLGDLHVCGILDRAVAPFRHPLIEVASA
jgi:hypothetical protein